MNMYIFINTLSSTVVAWSYAIESRAEVNPLLCIKHLWQLSLEQYCDVLI